MVNVAADAIIGEYGADTGEGIAVTPSGSTLYIAQTGQYITTDGCVAADAGLGAISMSTDCNTIFEQRFVRVRRTG